jgi:hypothetical protein
MDNWGNKIVDRTGPTALEVMTGQDQTSRDKEFVSDIKRIFDQCQTDWGDILTSAERDVQFYCGSQYDEQAARAARRSGNKVQVKANVIAPMVTQIDNIRRQQNISLTAHPTDEKGSDATAEVITSLFRHIENISNAKHAYNIAFGPSGSLVRGIGFLKVETKYINDNSFDQDIFISAPKNQWNILPDFNSHMADFSDAEYWFEFDEVTRTDYKKNYAQTTLASFPTWKGMSQKTNGWVNDNAVRLCKYWYKTSEVEMLVQFEDGTIGTVEEFALTQDDDGNWIPTDLSKIPSVVDQQILNGASPVPNVSDADPGEAYRTKGMEAEAYRRRAFHDIEDSSSFHEEELENFPVRPANIRRVRPVDKIKVKWVMTNGMEIIDRGEWHNDVFPFVGCVGNEIYVDGKRQIYGCVRYVRDMQTSFNFLNSELLRKTAATTKSQWLVDVDSIPTKFVNDWASSNVDEKAVLFWSSKQNNPNGNNPPPVRADLEEPALQGLLMSVNNVMQNIRMTLGAGNFVTPDIQNTQLSGVALNTIAEQGQLSNFHFSDNDVLSMKRLGEIILGLIPYVYDTPRVLPLIGPDNEVELIAINQLFTKNGKEIYHDLTSASYGITVDTGPGYATRRSQQMEQMIKFAQMEPQIAPVIAPDIAAQADWDVGGGIHDKLLKWQALTMPGLLSTNDDDIPPQAKAQIAALQQQVQVGQQHAQTLLAAYHQEKAKNESDMINNAAKERIEIIKLHGQLALKKADMLLDLQTAKDQMAVETTKMQLDHIHKKQQVVLEYLKHMDQASGINEPNLYRQLEEASRTGI